MVTHDPLCPYRPAQSGKCDRPFSDPNISCAVLHVSQPEVPCQCALIATVRADERKRDRPLGRPRKHRWFHGDCICQRVNAVEIYHGTALGNEIISVFIDGVRFVPASEPDAYAQGYEAALRDAVEAVRQVPGTTVIPDGNEWHEPFLIERSKVIAAIRNLQGKP